MTISSTTSRNNYTGDGSTNIYNFDFKVFIARDVSVIIRKISTGVEHFLYERNDYIVSGAGGASGYITLVNLNQEWIDSSGYLSAGYALTIKRVTELVQNTDIKNPSDYYPEAHENQYDIGVMADLQQQDTIDAMPKLPLTFTTSDFNTDLPASIVGSGNVSVITNTAGDGFEEGPTYNDIENARSASATIAANKASAEEDAAEAAALVAGAGSVRKTATIKPHATNFITTAATSTSYVKIPFILISGDSSFISLNANKFTLDPGEYRIKIPVGLGGGSWLSLQLYDETGAASLSENTYAAYSTSTAALGISEIEYELTVETQTEYSLKVKSSVNSGVLVYPWTTIDKIN